MMSNESGESSDISQPRHTGFVNGIPSSCWCGSAVVVKTSKTEANPYRRFYRCAYAMGRKVGVEGHIFKWEDEGIINLVGALSISINKLENELREKIREIEEMHKVHCEKMEEEVIEKVDQMLVEAKYNTKRAIIIVVVGCLIVLGISKMVV